MHNTFNCLFNTPPVIFNSISDCFCCNCFHYTSPCLVISILHLKNFQFNHVLNVFHVMFWNRYPPSSTKIQKPSIQIPLCDQIDHHIIIPIYENVHFKHFLYVMGFNLYPCVFNHHPQFSLLLTAFDTCWNNLTNNRLWLNWLTLSMLLILLYIQVFIELYRCLPL